MNPKEPQQNATKDEHLADQFGQQIEEMQSFQQKSKH